MGQRDVLPILQLNRGQFFSSKELAVRMGVSTKSASSNVKQLNQFKLINCIEEKVGANTVKKFGLW